MANTLNLGTDGNWGVKKDSLLAYNSENGNFKPLPFDFTRASSATVVNKDGLIEIVGSGKARIDFKDDAKGALLLEPTRSNLITYSEDFSNAAWTKSNSLITSNSVISPNGTLNADKLVESNFNGDHYVSSQIISVSSGQITNTIWLKSAERTQAVIFEQVSVKGIYVDLESGTFIKNLVNTPDSYSIFKDSNGWVKVSITTTNSSTSRLRIYPSKNGSVSYQGDGASGVYIYGAQLEQGSYATSYIPTQGSAVTRVADACNNAGNNQVINSTEGVLYIEADILKTSGTGFLASISNGLSLSESINIRQQSSGTLSFQLSSGGLNTFINTTDWSEGINKIALRYNSTGINVYINGNSKGINSAITYPNMNNLDIASRPDQIGQLIELLKVKDVRLYNTALTDAELQALTTL